MVRCASEVAPVSTRPDAAIGSMTGSLVLDDEQPALTNQVVLNSPQEQWVAACPAYAPEPEVNRLDEDAVHLDRGPDPPSGTAVDAVGSDGSTGKGDESRVSRRPRCRLVLQLSRSSLHGRARAVLCHVCVLSHVRVVGWPPTPLERSKPCNPHAISISRRGGWLGVDIASGVMKALVRQVHLLSGGLLGDRASVS